MPNLIFSERFGGINIKIKTIFNNNDILSDEAFQFYCFRIVSIQDRVPLEGIPSCAGSLDTRLIPSVMTIDFPLSNYPVLRTTDVTAIEDFMPKYHGGEALKIDQTPADQEAIVNWVSLGQSQYGVSAFGRGVTLKYPESDFLRVKIALAGQFIVSSKGATTRVDVNTGSISTGAITTESSTDVTILSYLVSKKHLSEKLMMLNDGLPSGVLDFHHRLDLTTLVGQNFLHTMRSMLALLSETTNATTVGLIKELEQALITALLLAAPLSIPSIANLGTRSVAPARVRRAEAFLVENWRIPFDAKNVAEAAGTSPRNLFRLFREFRGYTPLEFLKRLRLERAFARLRLGVDDASVTDIALDCGWNSASHFSKDFRENFGLTPSAVRRKAQD